MSSRTGRNNNKSESPIFGYLPINEVEKAYNDKTYMWNDDGSVSQIIRFYGMNNSAFSPEKYHQTYSAISAALSRISSKEITIGFYIMRNSKIETIEIPETMPVQVKERAKFLKKLAKNNEVFVNTFYISINALPNRNSIPLTQKVKSSISSIKSLFTGQTDKEKLNSLFENIKKRLKDVARATTTVTTLLDSMGVDFEVLDSKEDYFKALRPIVAPFKTTIQDLEAPTKFESFRKELFSGVECNQKRDHFILDGYFHQLFELDRIPSKMRVQDNNISALIDAPFEFIYGTVFRVMDYKETNSQMQKIVQTNIKQIEISKDHRGNIDDLNLIEDQKRFEEARQFTAAEGANAAEFASFFVYRKKMSSLVKQLKENSMDLNDFVIENVENLNQNVFSRLAQSEWISPDCGQWEPFCSYLPGVCNVSSNKFKTLIDLPQNLAYILPFFNRSRRDLQYSGINHFFTDSLTTETFEIIDPSQASWGYLVSGDMGSGKSVTLNLLISMSLKSLLVSGKNPIVRIVDYGGVTSSYFKLLKMMKGEYINFSKNSDLGIQILGLNPEQSLPNEKKVNTIVKILSDKLNISSSDEKRKLTENVYRYYQSIMDLDGLADESTRLIELQKIFPSLNSEDLKLFELKPGNCKPSPLKLKQILAIFEIMLSSDPEQFDSFRTEFNRDDVAFFVNHAYEVIENKFPRLFDVYELMVKYAESEDNSTIRSMSQRLHKWTYKGDFKMFDRDENDMDLSNDFIMFDLFGLDANPQLEAIYLLVITDLISTDMYTKQDRERVCVLDEAWAALKTKSMREVIVGFMRLSRKYRFAPMLASQLPTDFFALDPEDGKVIVSQATNYIFCGISDPTVAAETAHYYNLDEQTKNELMRMGVHTKGGTPNAPVYSKFLHVQKTKGDSRRINISRNILSPFEYQLYSSSKEDNAIFRYYLEKIKMNVTDVCFLLSRNEHIGDKGLIEHLRKTNNPEALRVVDK